MTDIARYRTVLAVLGLLVGLLFMLSLTVGPAAIAFSDSIKALLSDKGDAIALIMREIRLPRALLGLMIGATLGLSGAALQGYLRNPLAEPGLIGVVADLFKTDQKYETAIEVALGGRIQNIVTDNSATAGRMIRMLKDRKAGRATFLPLSDIQGGQGFRDPQVLGEEGVIG